MTKTATIAAYLAVFFWMTAPANAGSEVCGNYVFAGAYKSKGQAQRKANRLNAMALDLRKSNSPNNHKRLWVVAEGPLSRSEARNLVRRWKNRGVSAYSANRCFIGD